MNLYLAVGHGVQPNGRLDPGATDGPTIEHLEARRVCLVASDALHRCDVTHTSEADLAATADPDYRGSVKAVNAGRFDLAVEVHFDSAKSPRGGFGIYRDAEGRELAEHIRNRWGAAGLPQRQNYADVRGLYFLRATKCPALVWECDRISAHGDAEISRMGEAIAAGICDWFETPYHPPGWTPPTTIGEAMARFPNAVDACEAPGGGVWVLGRDGGVGHYNGAKMPGTGPVSYPGLPESQRQGERAFLRIVPSTRPGKLYDCLADDGSVYSF